MALEKLKLQRLCEAKKLRRLVGRRRRLVMDPKTKRQMYVTIGDEEGAAPRNEAVEKNASNESGGTLGEGERPQTPAFVRHCVTAITEKPAELERIERDAPAGTDGSPFAVCWAKYNEDKASLAAKHAKGKHHTVAQYEKALGKLRENVAAAREESLDRSQIVFGDIQETIDPEDRRFVRYSPGG
jgi:hypothetical protein